MRGAGMSGAFSLDADRSRLRRYRDRLGYIPRSQRDRACVVGHAEAVKADRRGSRRASKLRSRECAAIGMVAQLNRVRRGRLRQIRLPGELITAAGDGEGNGPRRAQRASAELRELQVAGNPLGSKSRSIRLQRVGIPRQCDRACLWYLP